MPEVTGLRQGSMEFYLQGKKLTVIMMLRFFQDIKFFPDDAKIFLSS